MQTYSSVFHILISYGLLDQYIHKDVTDYKIIIYITSITKNVEIKYDIGWTNLKTNDK